MPLTHDPLDTLPELNEADMAELQQHMQRATGRIVNVFQAVLGLLLGGFVFAVIFLGLASPAHASDTCWRCGWYVDGGISVHRAMGDPARGKYWTHDINTTRNPYAVVAVGYQLTPAQHLALSLSLRHESSIATGLDHGTNSAVLSLRWMPWGQP